MQHVPIPMRRRRRLTNRQLPHRRVTLRRIRVGDPSSVEIEVFGAILSELEAANDNDPLESAP